MKEARVDEAARVRATGEQMPGFKEWLQQKADASPEEQRRRKLQDWKDAYDTLIHRIRQWLEEDGAGQIKFSGENVVSKVEEGLGPYRFQTLKIVVGDDSIEVVPIARNVIAHLGDPSLRAAGRVDITNGVRNYALYRVVRDGESVWYVVNDSNAEGELSKDKLETIMMDLMP
jgi:hypothetical protein